MNAVLLGVMALGGGLAGWWGWHRATKTVYRRAVYRIDPPPGRARHEYERSIRRRRKVMRMVVTFLYTLTGALSGIVILMVIAPQHR